MRGFSFSWKRALGISSAKARLSRQIGIPLTSSGRQRKIGRMASGWFSAWLVESAYQSSRPAPRRRPRSAAPATAAMPGKPTMFGTALVAAIPGCIAGTATSSWGVFWAISAAAFALMLAFGKRPEAEVVEGGGGTPGSADDAPAPLSDGTTCEGPAPDYRGVAAAELIPKLETEHRPIPRHFLLISIVESAYRDRARHPAMRDLCERVGLQHVAEFPAFVPALREEFGMLPRVPTFQLLATVLTERGDFARAIEVCQAALSHGLHDNTVGGFEGRIERIRKKQAVAKG